jgi:thiamine biosynthesis lipoprotein
MSKRRELALVVVAAGLVAVAVVCGMKPGRSADAVLERFEAQQPHMGTIFRIVVYAADEKQARQACQAAFQRIAQLDNTMSDYKEDSELMRVCREAAGKPVKVSPDLFGVLVAAQEIAQASDGAFDVTIGPVVRLWRRARRQQQLPDAKQLEMARQLVGYQKLRLDRQHQTVELAQPGMILDLGGIGKGYAADAALAVLVQHGLPRALVAAGGDIRVGEPPPHAQWLEGGYRRYRRWFPSHGISPAAASRGIHFRRPGTICGDWRSAIFAYC